MITAAKASRVRTAHAEPTLAPARRHLTGPGRGWAVGLVRNAHATGFRPQDR